MQQKSPAPTSSEPGRSLLVGSVVVTHQIALVGGDPDELVAARLTARRLPSKQYHLVGYYSHIPQDHLLS